MYALIEEFGEVFFLLAVLLVFVAVLVVAVVATIATRLHSGGVSMSWLSDAWKSVTGAAGGIIGSLVGGAFGRSGDRDARLAQERANEANLAAQREFAQHGIRWKVEDAKAAGLHPLFALGGSGATFSPSFQVSGTEGNWKRDMGQNPLERRARC